MGEKATIFQTTQIGVESTLGTPVAANKKLLSVSLSPNPRVESQPFRPDGNKYASFSTLNKEWSEVGIDGKPTFNEIIYMLASLCHYAVPVQQGATAAYKWTFVSNTSAEDVGKSFTVEQGDANSAWRVAGTKVSGLSLKFNRSEIGMSGTAIGEAIEKGITMTASPTSLAPVPMLPAQMKFYMADTQAGLAGATAMTRGYAIEWNLNNKFGLNWPVGQDPIAVEGEPDYTATIKVATDTAGLSLLDNMRNATAKWFRVKLTGNLIAPTYYHDFQLDFPANVLQPSNFENQENILAIPFGLAPIHDAAWGKSFQIDVITNVATL